MLGSMWKIGKAKTGGKARVWKTSYIGSVRFFCTALSTQTTKWCCCVLNKRRLFFFNLKIIKTIKEMCSSCNIPFFAYWDVHYTLISLIHTLQCISSSFIRIQFPCTIVSTSNATQIELPQNGPQTYANFGNSWLLRFHIILLCWVLCAPFWCATLSVNLFVYVLVHFQSYQLLI